jgi:beta-phosphoglucomutase family hydrolase
MRTSSSASPRWEAIVAEHDALLFDLDGTLVDTMALHFLAYADVFRARSYVLAQSDYMRLVGAPARETIPQFCRATGMPLPSASEIQRIHAEKKVAFGRIVQTHAIPVLRAASLLIDNIGRKKLALVTSGNRQGSAQILDSLGWTRIFDCVVSGDDVANGKPHPEPYLMAAARLGVEPASCVVIEDTPAGIESGRRAGMSVIDVRGAASTHDVGSQLL